MSRASRASAEPFIPAERFAALTRDKQAKLAMLWQAVATATPGEPLPELAPLPTHDPRFRARAWRDSPFHSLLAQAYLLHGEYLMALADNAVLPDAERKRLKFLTRQYVDAIAPSNFPATNPDVGARARAPPGPRGNAGAAPQAAAASLPAAHQLPAVRNPG